MWIFHCSTWYYIKRKWIISFYYLDQFAMDIKYYRCFQGLWESMNQIWVYDLNIVTLLTDLENVRCLLEHQIILNHDFAKPWYYDLWKIFLRIFTMTALPTPMYLQLITICLHLIEQYSNWNSNYNSKNWNKIKLLRML